MMKEHSKLNQGSAEATTEARAGALAEALGQARLALKMPSRRQLLLKRLANLPTSHRAVQRLMEEFEPERPTFLENAQKDLQKIWPKSVPIDAKQVMVDAWLCAATKRLVGAGLHAWLVTGRLEFDYKSFPGQFVVAILENWRRFAVCGNPECEERYFFAKRSTQRYCERGECTRYALRKKAKNWWTEHRAKKHTATNSKGKKKGRIYA